MSFHLFRYAKCALMLSGHISKWLKNGGSKTDQPLTDDKMLDLDLTNSEKLSKDQVFIGAKTKALITEMGLKLSSPELDDFFGDVFRYMKSTRSMIKYFKPTLGSLTAKYLNILSPDTKSTNIDEQKIRWK